MVKDASHPRGRACGVCQERKILCDRARPACQRCVKSKRACNGYSLRLSWPRRNDHRRAVVAAPRMVAEASNPLDIDFLNVYAWHMEVHKLLRTAGFWDTAVYRKVRRESALLPAPASPVRWMPYDLNPSDKVLLSYFESVACSSLLTYGEDSTILRNALLRMALSTNSPAAAGVFKSLLAISSLHRHGLQSQAIRHHIAALQAMGESASRGLGDREVCLHIAAGMLLGSYESQIVSASYSEWAKYICNSRNLVRLMSSMQVCREDSDYATLLGWMHYHYVVGCFTVVHWHDMGLPARCLKPSRPSAPGDGQPLLNAIRDVSMLPHPPGPAHRILHLLLRVLQSVLDPSHSRFYTEQHQSRLDTLEKKIKDVRLGEPDPKISLYSMDSSALAELYQLAALIYLERYARNVMGESPQVNRLADRAFQLLEETGTCNWPFLLLIFGCEASTEARRRFILRLIAEAETGALTRNVSHARRMVTFIWVQDDLGTTWPSSLSKMETMFNTSEDVPTFL